MPTYYNRSGEDVLRQLHSSPKGLTEEQARQIALESGPNALTEGKKKGVVRIFLEQFKDLLVLILIIAAVVSLLSGHGESTFVIFAVILLNAVLGTVQYFKAEKSLASLKAMSSPSAKVLRGGVKLEIPSREVVPGDIVLLEAGDLVVADGRILENYSLKVNESSLTGESEGVDKSAEILSGDTVALGDQKNMVFSGSLVTYGRATVVITATGMRSELGKIASLMNQTQQRKTPLQQSLDNFSKKLALIILVICALVFGLSMYREASFLDSLMFAVALAVAAIPEALSSIVTIVLALGTQKMARQNAIIKDLKAVESLGSVSVICSDKTGTLTQNRMCIQQIYADGVLLDGRDLDLANPAQRLLLKTAVLASDATDVDGVAIGDPTEIALVQLADVFGVEEVSYREQHPRLGEIAFDSDRKLMSTLHDVDGVPTLMTKGAIDVLLSRSTRLLTAQGTRPLTEADRQVILGVNTDLSENGLRVLAFACRELDAPRQPTLEDETDFTFIGLISMIDPPRPESVQAVADARRGGIRTVMITGDHKVTATAIARQIGIFDDGDLAVDGVELDAMPDSELDEKLPRIAVYARVSPEHKIRIVSAWQRCGCIVSMTGDGVNDAPSIRAADIGIGMGITGTDVTKNVADMVLADDNFATIVGAVEEGRRIYDNIQRAIKFLLGSNMSEVLSIFTATMLGFTILEPVHLLWINLLTDCFPALALGMERAEPNVMSRPPRSARESIFAHGVGFDCVYQGVMCAVLTLAAFFIGHHMEYGAWTLTNSPDGTTMAFLTLSMAEIFHSFNMRAHRASIFTLRTPNWTLVGAAAASLALTTLCIYVPFLADAFDFTAISAAEYAVAMGLAVLVIPVVELVKCVQRAVEKRAAHA